MKMIEPNQARARKLERLVMHEGLQYCAEPGDAAALLLASVITAAMKVLVVPSHQVNHEVNSLAGLLTPLIKVGNFDLGSSEPPLLLNHAQGIF